MDAALLKQSSPLDQAVQGVQAVPRAAPLSRLAWVAAAEQVRLLVIALLITRSTQR